MSKQRPLYWKAFLYCATLLGILFIGTVLWLGISLHISGQHDRQSVSAAVNDIKLPSPYRLVSSVYDNQRCLDVCAHTILTYKAADGSKLSEHDVTTELKLLGYTYDYNSQYCSKNYKNKKVHVTQTSASPSELSLDVSL